MLDLLNKSEVKTENAITTAAKRERIETELRADASRSDRKIAETIGCDHKTVGAARARLGNSISPADPSSTQMRKMLIAGVEDFDSKFPQDTTETAEELVDRAIAEGQVSTKPGTGGEDRHETSQSVTKRHGVTPPMTIDPSSHAGHMLGLAGDGDEDDEAEVDRETYWPIPSQAAIECRQAENGAVEIWQEGQHSPEEDVTIHIAAGNAVMLARHILYAAGFPNVSMYIHVRGEGNVDLNNGDLAETFKDANKPKPGYGPVR
jgi:hypothetical protein